MSGVLKSGMHFHDDPSVFLPDTLHVQSTLLSRFYQLNERTNTVPNVGLSVVGSKSEYRLCWFFNVF